MNIVILPRFQKSYTAKDIDFLPARIRLARRKRRNIFLAGFFGMMLAMSLYFIYAYPQSLIREYERELAVENAMIQDLERGKEVYERLQARKARHDALVAALLEIEKQRFEALEIMEKIASAMPAGVMISKLSISPSKVSITVVSKNPIDTARVLVSLRRLDIFKEVELAGAPMVQEPKEVSFELALKDRPAESNSVAANLLEVLKHFARKFIFKEGEESGWLTGGSVFDKAQVIAA